MPYDMFPSIVATILRDTRKSQEYLEAKIYSDIEDKKIWGIEYPFQINNITTLEDVDDQVGFWSRMTKEKETSAKDFDPFAKDFDLKIYEVILYLEVYWIARKLQQQKCWIDGWIWITTNLPTRIPIQEDP